MIDANFSSYFQKEKMVYPELRLQKRGYAIGRRAT